MKKILLLDTSIGTSNLGDFIIMECVRKELQPVLEGNFVYAMPTHLPPFHAYAVRRNSFAVQNYANADLKLAGGSNLLVKDLRTHYPQWNIHKRDAAPLAGVVLVGVGAGAGDRTNAYTTKLYQQVLSHTFIHSVRDERSRQYVESLGLKALNTGCVTMWMLTPAFCSTIPAGKANRCVFTLTGNKSGRANPQDQQMVDILLRNYEEVFFWVQGDMDAEYFSYFENTERVRIIPPSLPAYAALLSEEDLDYVGTRLHGGIYAMRHGKRSIIIGIDERADAIHRSNHLNYIRRDEIGEKLERMIGEELPTEVTMPYEAIEAWKAQF